jgi:hypothetical protein
MGVGSARDTCIPGVWGTLYHKRVSLDPEPRGADLEVEASVIVEHTYIDDY